MKLAIISVTNNGDKLAEKIASEFKAEVYCSADVKKSGLKELTGQLFKAFEGLIFIASSGIAVRAIASFIEDKTKDPAVVVMDCTGKFVISLLSGHMGGANRLTEDLAGFLEAIPVITTATDNLGIKAPDSFAAENGLVIESMEKAKLISSMLIKRRKVAFVNEVPQSCTKKMEMPKGYAENLNDAEAAVLVTDRDDVYIEELKDIPVLRLIKKDVVIGIGCRKGFSSSAMLDEVCEKLRELHIDKRAVKIVATVEIKREEAAIIDTAVKLNAEFKVFSLEDIEKIQERFEGSSFVEKTIGVKAVCEPCVELSGAEIISGKIKCHGMTVCIGKIND